MVKIIVDCFGCDHGPEANIEGSLKALQTFPDLKIILTGDEAILRKCLEGRSYEPDRLEIVHAPEVVEVNEKPTDAIRLKKESSLMKGIRLLREDETVNGMVSAGSSGAVVAAAMLRIGRLKNVIRPVFCPILPTMNGGIVAVCDSGANVDVTPEYLHQYALLGSLYMREVYGIQNPRVALLNVGVEPEKGDALHKEAYKLLAAEKNICFVGNMESRDLLTGNYDLVVCDGFSGNVLIKSAEGTALEVMKLLKKNICSRFLYKLGALFMRKMFSDVKEFMNYQNYGGSVLLGLNKVVVKGHGSSRGQAIYKCIEQAYRLQSGGYSEKAESILPAYEKTKG